MAVDALLARLQGCKSRGANHWVSRCPAHKDKTPSLSITVKDDGRILLHDFGGCSPEAVLDSVGLTLSDLFPVPLAHRLERVPMAGSHTHAAADALKVIAREALVIAIAAEDMAAGLAPTPAERDRLLEAVRRVRGAASWV